MALVTVSPTFDQAKNKINKNFVVNIGDSEFGNLVVQWREQDKGILTSHIEKVHEKKKSQLCMVCDKKFSCNSGLKAHIKSVHEKISHKCLICDKTFPYKCTLKNHIESIHEGKKSCPSCKYSCLEPRDLRQHIVSVHQVKKSYKCLICESIFTTNGSLKKHIKSIHNEEKKEHNCLICGHEFSLMSNLKTHIESVHEGKKPFKCSFCEKDFSLKGTLKRHLESIHEG